MFILYEKSTGIVRDCVGSPFAVSPEFEWIEDNNATRQHIGFSYNKETKVFTAPVPAPMRTPEPSSREIYDKLHSIEQSIGVLTTEVQKIAPASVDSK